MPSLSQGSSQSTINPSPLWFPGGQLRYRPAWFSGNDISYSVLQAWYDAVNDAELVCENFERGRIIAGFRDVVYC